mmetsp:Transcript_22061/g.38093  ORF Transcript_22061/g.38093 Transcript_22061/m.38093 type:complete len:210 (-) Transcript_22061:485-1114(-)
MAINVPVVQYGDRKLPQPFPGEAIIIERSHVECELNERLYGKWKSVEGMLFLTSLRLVFITSEKCSSKSRFESLELPLQGIWDEKLNQPIFGCNNISGTSQYYDNQPFQGTLTFKLYFMRGGVGTFVPQLNWALQAARRALQRSQQAEIHTNVPFMGSSEILQMQSVAYVDPSDPSTVYTMQPSIPVSAPADGTHTLRRRNVTGGGGLQ